MIRLVLAALCTLVPLAIGAADDDGIDTRRWEFRVLLDGSEIGVHRKNR